MIKNKILQNLEKVLSKLNVKGIEIDLQPPANADFGGYSTSIALKLTKILKKNPLIIAEEIKNSFPKEDLIEKIEVVKPGFINFWISKMQLTSQLHEVLNNNFKIPEFCLGKNKKIMVEYTDPNLFKEFHIGHLYSNIVGESLACIFDTLGGEVKRVNYQGDVGLHVAKALWGMIQNMKKEKLTITDINKLTASEKAKFMGKSYSLGTIHYENEKNKKEIIDLNKKIYQSDPSIKDIYNQGRIWSLEYFEKIYERLGTKFDYYFFEKEVGEIGLKYVQDNFKKVFEKSKGAVVFNGEKYGLHTRVFINSLGLPTYEAKDLGLASAKYKKFPYDLSIIVVGNEIKEYFKVVHKALEQINPVLRKKTINIFTGMINLPEGKMSSRLGNIITAESLLDELHRKAWEKIQETKQQKIENQSARNSNKTDVISKKQDSTAESVAIAAVKYALLKNSIGQNIEFNINESVSFDGNSGPYLLYTYVRCRSVLEKADELSFRVSETSREIYKKDSFASVGVTNGEFGLIRKLYQFPEVVLKSAEKYSPNFIATYLHELASQFNLFYQKNPILKAEKEKKELRLLTTEATANVIKKGLELLGIKTVEKM